MVPWGQATSIMWSGRILGSFLGNLEHNVIKASVSLKVFSSDLDEQNTGLVGFNSSITYHRHVAAKILETHLY